MVLAASIVGSGELIATTTLGAQAGYAALWVVLLSCCIKPVIQAELGRYTIATGETAWRPQPLAGAAGVARELGGVGWAIMVVVHAAADRRDVRRRVAGHAPGRACRVRDGLGVIFFVITLALLLGGGYGRIERIAMVKVALFTVLTVLAAMVLMGCRDFSVAEWPEGCVQLPPAGLAMAVAVFGITGVGASELVMYPYWCVEKGYARFTGPRDGSAAWCARARGWIRVMHVDIVVSMIIYTVATMAFYLLGAGVLHGMGLVPASADMIPVLSNIYTQTLGGWALWRLLRGRDRHALRHRFSRPPPHTPAMFADMCRLGGRFAPTTPAARHVPRPLRRAAHVRPGALIPAAIAGDDGDDRRHRAGDHAARHRHRRDRSAPPPAAVPRLRPRC